MKKRLGFFMIIMPVCACMLANESHEKTAEKAAAELKMLTECFVKNEINEKGFKKIWGNKFIIAADVKDKDNYFKDRDAHLRNWIKGKEENVIVLEDYYVQISKDKQNKIDGIQVVYDVLKGIPIKLLETTFGKHTFFNKLSEVPFIEFEFSYGGETATITGKGISGAKKFEDCNVESITIQIKWKG